MTSAQDDSKKRCSERGCIGCVEHWENGVFVSSWCPRFLVPPPHALVPRAESRKELRIFNVSRALEEKIRALIEQGE